LNKLALPGFSKRTARRHLQDHVEASKAVFVQREEELNTVGLSQKMPANLKKKPAAMTPANRRK
jgi:hypothetical protein